MRVLIGDISDVTLAKWIKNAVFPKPIIGKNGHHTWRLGAVLDWIDAEERRSSKDAEQEQHAA